MKEYGFRYVDRSRSRSCSSPWAFETVRLAPIDIPTPFESFDDYWQPFLNDVAPAPGYCVSLNAEERAKLEVLVRDALPIDPD
jgi:hypothetical protein